MSLSPFSIVMALAFALGATPAWACGRALAHQPVPLDPPPHSEQEEGFWLAIRENSSDSAQWLVYSDWLEEQGRGVEAKVLRRFSALQSFALEAIAANSQYIFIELEKRIEGFGMVLETGDQRLPTRYSVFGFYLRVFDAMNLEVLRRLLREDKAWRFSQATGIEGIVIDSKRIFPHRPDLKKFYVDISRHDGLRCYYFDDHGLLGSWVMCDTFHLPSFDQFLLAQFTHMTDEFNQRMFTVQEAECWNRMRDAFVHAPDFEYLGLLAMGYDVHFARDPQSPFRSIPLQEANYLTGRVHHRSRGHVVKTLRAIRHACRATP